MRFEPGRVQTNWVMWDDVSGRELRSDLVQAARKEELEVVRNMKVWTKVPRSQCLADTGRQPIGTRLVDTNTGDDDSPTVRSRIVAQELKRSSEFELFAATPPIDYMFCCRVQGEGRCSRRRVVS